MNSKFLVLLVALCFALGVWGCEDVPPDAAGTVKIAGVVRDLSTSAVIQNATVFINAGGTLDSVVTGTDGSFTFEVGVNALADGGTITVKKSGYEVKDVNVPNANATSFDISLKPDLSNSALIVGTLRDSTTLYPLRGGTVILTLPGVVDQFVTLNDGNFRLVADLVDRDSLPVTLTTVKDGYKTKSFGVTVHRGQTKDVGNVLMQVDGGSSVVTVLGRIIDNTSHNPVNNAMVTLATPIYTDSVATGGDGSFSFTVNLQGLSSVAGTVKAAKSGYRTNSYNFSANAGDTFTQDLTILRDTTTGVPIDSAGTGNAHSIALISLSSREISVYGVGGTESSVIIWEVRDSLGFPIDIDHRDTVMFSLSGVPTTGANPAYVSPSTAMTNVSGRVATTINSGTVSGVMQFVASLRRESDGQVISSTPVVITVNAGLPDQVHFSLAPVEYNFPGLDWLGRTDRITVQVGDKYSNPVKTNTAVYFNTTGGIINASGFTNPDGQASVDLHSGAPRPSDPTYGNGFAWTRAMTVGENGATVQDSILILFSGFAEISGVSPSTFAVNAASGHTSGPISFTVSDANGNPLSQGTHIQVTLQYTPPPNTTINLTVNGDIDVTLGDTQAKGIGTTQFSFSVVDQSAPALGSPIPVTATIKVTSRNGNPPVRSINGTIGG
jgi:hypothetical protein